MSKILELRAQEILDSRGRPTIQCAARLVSGAVGLASVPSGASTGRHEARELRDGDPKRYRGLGCLQAVAHIQGEIQSHVRELEPASQRELDDCLVHLDGTANKSRLGTNALLAVSIAFAKAMAIEGDMELFAYFGSLYPGQVSLPFALPLPTINLFSGGQHAGGQVAIQDILIVPLPEGTLPEQLVMMAEIYATAVDLVQEKYGMRNLSADEGGLAPPFASAHAMLEDAMTCAEAAGFVAGQDFRIAIDAAASQFHTQGAYRFDDSPLSAAELIDIYAHWCSTYPIYSIEDGLAEDDWDGWQELYQRLGDQVIVLGDDLLCTNPARIRKAQDRQAANALLLKVNQIGTLTETFEAVDMARRAGYTAIASHRSGETEDAFIADLAVALEVGQIKTGSLSRSDRLAKYNQLLRIEEELGANAHYPGLATFSSIDTRAQ